MAYRFNLDRSPRKELVRIVREQIDRALAAVSDQRLAFGERVHVARTSCKRIRAVLRLVRRGRPRLWRQENAFFRDAAHELGPLREAAVMPDTVGALAKYFQETIPPRRLAGLRHRVSADARKLLSDRANTARILSRFERLMRKARRRFGRVKPGIGADYLKVGFSRSYRGAFRAWREIALDSSGTRFHECRKRTKVHAYHCRLLRDLWPEMMRAQQEALGALSGKLGEEHDLAMLARWLGQHEPGARSAAAVCLRGLIAVRREELRRDAVSHGKRLFADDPDAFKRRLRCWWSTRLAGA